VKLSLKLLPLMFTLITHCVLADTWRQGKVGDLGSGYDGSSITFRLYDLSENSASIDYSRCTCNSSWNKLCLDPTRKNFDKEYALLLAASASNKNVNVIFNDDVCSVKAIVLPFQ